MNENEQTLLKNSEFMQELEEYLCQSALTQKVPLPRWATW